MRVAINGLGFLMFLFPGSSGAPAPSRPQGEYLRTPERFELQIVTVAYDESTVGVELEATERLPHASGEAKVERKKGITEIEIELDEMKPAWSFGGDFNTYLLWAVSAEGQADNLGEFVLEGNRSKLDVSTRLDTFGLVVTAEPHFMVEVPSSFVVLTSLAPSKSMPRAPERAAVQITSSRQQYRYERETLAAAPEPHGEIHSALRQAQVAVQMARLDRADALAPEAFEQASNALLMAEGAAETRSPTHADVERMARRVVRLAAAAQRNAEEARKALTPSEELEAAIR